MSLLSTLCACIKSLPIGKLVPAMLAILGAMRHSADCAHGNHRCSGANLVARSTVAIATTDTTSSYRGQISAGVSQMAYVAAFETDLDSRGALAEEPGVARPRAARAG